MIIAMVPGPAVLGIASGTKAMLAVGSSCSSSDLIFASIESWAFCWGNSMRKPIKATINPPAIRSPGIDMPNVFITTWPAYHDTIRMAKTYTEAINACLFRSALFILPARPRNSATVVSGFASGNSTARPSPIALNKSNIVKKSPVNIHFLRMVSRREYTGFNNSNASLLINHLRQKLTSVRKFTNSDPCRIFLF